MLLHFLRFDSRDLVGFVKISVTQNKVKNSVLRKGDIENNKHSNMTHGIIKIYGKCNGIGGQRRWYPSVTA